MRQRQEIYKDAVFENLESLLEEKYKVGVRGMRWDGNNAKLSVGRGNTQSHVQWQDRSDVALSINYRSRIRMCEPLKFVGSFTLCCLTSLFLLIITSN